MSPLPALRSLIRRWPLAIMLALCVIGAELIGVQRFELGPASVTLLPLLFAFVIGLALNPYVVRPMGRILSRGDVRASGRMVAVAVMPLIAFLSVFIGPELPELMRAGPALVLQELGNLGTMLIAMPVAVLLFRMQREAVGATFSIAREGGLAYIFNVYGGASPEARGVMGVYVCGTLLGTVFFSILPGLVLSFVPVDMRAAAMACGIGSASMTAACSTSLSALSPGDAQQINAFAAASNLISGVTTLFMVVFITMPLAEAYYRRLDAMRAGAGPA